MAYDINYNDKRFTEVNKEKNAALKEADKTYDSMIKESDKYYQTQIDASKEWADKQSQLQQEKTDFAIEKVEQQKEQAQKDYIKEQQGAYYDWQKQSNPYGVNAEQRAASGLENSGYSESSKTAMYVAYQNRVATAREAYSKAVLNYDNAIKEAQLQNSSALAEIAYNSLQQQLELSLQGFQYKNTLVLAKADKKAEIDDRYYNRYQNVLSQINTENALAEQVRQYNASLAEERRQFNYKQSNSSSIINKKKDDSESNSDLIISKKKDNSNSNLTVDTNSVIDLGYGPISASKLNSLVASGEVIEYEEDGKLKYKKGNPPMRLK